MAPPHERFEAWQYAHRLVVEVYRVTKSWPLEERYTLSAQVRRSAYSVSSAGRLTLRLYEAVACRGKKKPPPE